MWTATATWICSSAAAGAGRYPEPSSSTNLVNDQGRLAPSEGSSRPFKASGGQWCGRSQTWMAMATRTGAGHRVGPIRIFRIKADNSRRDGRVGSRAHDGMVDSVVAGDFDGDGKPDLACGNWAGTRFTNCTSPTTLRSFYGDWRRQRRGTPRSLAERRNWLPGSADRHLASRGLPTSSPVPLRTVPSPKPR